MTAHTEDYAATVQLAVLDHIRKTLAERPGSTMAELMRAAEDFIRAEAAQRDRPGGSRTPGSRLWYLARAREDHGVETDEDAIVSFSRGGAYVQVWLWVEEPERRRGKDGT